MNRRIPVTLAVIVRRTYTSYMASFTVTKRISGYRNKPGKRILVHKSYMRNKQIRKKKP